jgi:Neprosin
VKNWKNRAALVVALALGLAGLGSVPASADPGVPSTVTADAGIPRTTANGAVAPGGWRVTHPGPGQQSLAVPVAKSGKVVAAPPSPFAGPGYYYAGTFQTMAGTDTFKGLDATVEVVAPVMDPVGYNHSLSELAIQDANGNAAEIGWVEEPVAFGDSKPRLFSCIWVNGSTAPGCYTGAGTGTSWVDNTSNPINLGADLSGVVTATWPANAKKFTVKIVSGIGACSFASNGVEIDYDGVKVGCWLGTAWTHATPATSFGQATTAQAYGEYYYGGGNNTGTSADRPCGDIGNGRLGTAYNGAPIDATDPAYVASLLLLNKAPATITENFVANSPTDTNAYNVQVLSTRTYTYGGYGYHVTTAPPAWSSPGIEGGC